MSRAEHAQKITDEMREKNESSGGFDNDRVEFNYLTFEDKEKKTLRVLPLPEALAWYLKHDEGEYTEDAFPYHEFFKHWKVGTKKAQVACLSKHLNEPCPVCELIEELKGTGDEDDKDYASDMWASGRFVWFVIDREDCDDEKWFVWEVSRTVSESLMSLIANTRIPDLDHVFDGTDIEVTRNGKARDPKTTYQIFDTREVTYLYTAEDGEFDYERAERLLSKMTNVKEYGAPFLNYDESAALMNGENIVDILKARNNEGTTEEVKEEPKAEAPKGRGRGRGRK